MRESMARLCPNDDGWYRRPSIIICLRGQSQLHADNFSMQTASRYITSLRGQARVQLELSNLAFGDFARYLNPNWISTGHWRQRLRVDFCRRAWTDTSQGLHFARSP